MALVDEHEYNLPAKASRSNAVHNPAFSPECDALPPLVESPNGGATRSLKLAGHTDDVYGGFMDA